jgi:hypothetical protein
MSKSAILRSIAKRPLDPKPTASAMEDLTSHAPP